MESKGYLKDTRLSTEWFYICRQTASDNDCSSAGTLPHRLCFILNTNFCQVTTSYSFLIMHNSQNVG